MQSHVPRIPDMSPLVAYYRVSSQKQGRSGLGLEAQRKAVAAFASAEGFEIIANTPRSKPAKVLMRSNAGPNSRRH